MSTFFLLRAAARSWACGLLLLATTATLAQTPSSRATAYARQLKQLNALVVSPGYNQGAAQQQKQLSARHQARALAGEAQLRGEGAVYLQATVLALELEGMDSGLWGRRKIPIGALEQELKQATFPVRPLLHSLLGEAYHQYLRTKHYRQDLNAWGPEQEPKTSIAHWSDERLEQASWEHYRLSLLEAPDQQRQLRLRATPYLLRGLNAHTGAGYETLLDLIYSRAVAGLPHGSLAPASATDSLRTAHYYAALLGSTASFTRQLLSTDQPVGADSQTLPLWAWALQRWENAQPATATGQAIVRLTRLESIAAQAPEAYAKTLYRDALRQGARDYRHLPIAAEYLALAAQQWLPLSRDSALALCQEGLQRYPASLGGRQCEALRYLLQRPQLSVSTASLQVPADSAWSMQVTTQNVPRVHAWAFRLPLALMPRPEELANPSDAHSTAHIRAYRYVLDRHATPAAAWQVAPAAPDGVAHDLSGPALPSGHYLVVYSATATPAEWDQLDSNTQCLFLQASKLVALRRQMPARGTTSLLLLNRRTGLPQPGVQARYVFTPPVDSLPRLSWGPVSSPQPGADGWLHLRGPAPTRQGYSHRADLLLSYAADSLLVPGPAGPPDSSAQAAAALEGTSAGLIVTDRSTYAPGDTVHYKIILTRNTPTWHVGAGLVDTLQVTLPGAATNRIPIRTNAFGSYSGTLVLPDSLAAGYDYLTLNLGRQQLTLSLRPPVPAGMQVIWADLPKQVQRQELVTVRGRVLSPKGQEQPGLRVRYQVVREVVRLHKNGVYGDPVLNTLPAAEQVLDAGTVQTGPDGGWSFSFRAAAPADVPPARLSPGQLAYRVRVQAVAYAGTDSVVSFRELPLDRPLRLLHLHAPAVLNRQDLVPLRVACEASSAAAREATGQLELYRVSGTAAELSSWASAWLEHLTGEQPLDYPDLEPTAVLKPDLAKLSKELVATQPFDTRSMALPELNAVLRRQAPGVFLLRVRTTDSLAQPAQADFALLLYDAAAACLPFPTPDWFIGARALAPADTGCVVVGSQTGGPMLVEFGAADRVLAQQWLRLRAGEQQHVCVPATARGAACWLRTTQWQQNRLYTHASPLLAPAHAPQLRLLRARRRTSAAGVSRWQIRLRVQDAQGRPVAAEALAKLVLTAADQTAPSEPLYAQHWVPQQTGEWQDRTRAVAAYAVAAARIDQGYYPQRTAPGLRLLGETAISALEGDSVELRRINEGLPVASAPYPSDWDAAATSDWSPAYAQQTSAGQRLSLPLPPAAGEVPAGGWHPALTPRKNGRLKVTIDLPANASPSSLRLLVHTPEAASQLLTVPLSVFR
ncbi:hypothetical protein LJ737_11130 [Hymenobacter sp. 15J16-1T3B]|uniref:hypothetical protein n=1 Tax=Hymenobacter sp. 15J16-1T3B TaxID=2886941 RepID=UPI001D12C938|nr:hypothetical protein [Hymenobacter sp. 15J16-1T3B]MCC3157791.1 hypothetical protein [Hymenobacter sp. 15J16-1T3B]